MKSVLAQFLGIAFLVVVIFAFIFGLGGETLRSETTELNTTVTSPTVPTPESIRTTTP